MNYPFLKKEKFGLRTQETFIGKTCEIYIPEDFFNKSKPEIAIAKELGDRVRELERIVVLRTVDEKWIDYLDAMEQLKESVRLQGYAQKDPVVEFQRESYDYFNEMTSSIDETVVKTMLHLVPREKVERVNLIRNMIMNMQAAQQAGGPEKPQPKTNKSEKVGRNDPCPCGSGKKYKQCCGKNA